MLEHRQGQPPIETEHMTSRGLEFRTTEGGMKRSYHKRQAYAAVLEEQERQWVTGCENPDRIAAAYQYVSCKCQGLALLRGIQDEHEIRDFVKATPPSKENDDSSSPSLPPCMESTAPCKPYEAEITCRRLQVLDDIKILSGASELEFWHANPAAA